MKPDPNPTHFSNSIYSYLKSKWKRSNLILLQLWNNNISNITLSSILKINIYIFINSQICRFFIWKTFLWKISQPKEGLQESNCNPKHLNSTSRDVRNRIIPTQFEQNSGWSQVRENRVTWPDALLYTVPHCQNWLLDISLIKDILIAFPMKTLSQSNAFFSSIKLLITDYQ